MSNPDLLHHIRILPFDAIWQSSPFGNIIQAATTTAHEVLRSLVPLDAQGCFAWANPADPVEADAEAERILSLVEGAGLSLGLL